MSRTRSRYTEVLAQIKLHYFETVAAIVVIVFLTAFAIHELREAIQMIVSDFRAP